MSRIEGPPAATPFSAYQKMVIVMLALLQFTVVLDFMILSPLGDLLMKSLDMDTDKFGSVVSAYGVSAGISGFLAAGFADRYDRKKLLMFFYVGFLIGTIFCGLANSYETLFLARVITGIFGGVIGAVAMAVITDLFTFQQRGRVMGFVQMAFSASQIFGIPLGLLIADKLNWNATFYMVALLALIVGLLVLFRLKPLTGHLKLQKKHNAFVHLWHTLKKREYRIGFLATAVLTMGGFMLMPFTSAFLVNNVHIQQKHLFIVFFFTGLASIAIMPVIGRLSDRMNKFNLFTAGSILASIMIVIYTNLEPVHIGMVIFINMILFMGVMSRMVPATALNSGIPDAVDRGAYMSANGSLQQMAGGIAAYLAGKIVIQRGEHDPIENFDVLGYIMVGFFFWSVYLIHRVTHILRRRSRLPLADQPHTAVH